MPAGENSAVMIRIQTGAPEGPAALREMARALREAARALEEKADAYGEGKP